ncbi:MAG: hypothetical protein HFJ20_06665 [Clostridia bacterium]|nr:hypothetical protein [Clostridia bacterium]
MKKSLIIIIVICVIALIMIASIGGYFLIKVLNQEKNPMTVDAFKSLIRDKGYTIIDVKEQFNEYDYIEDAYVAILDDGEYQIEFYKMSNEESAIMFYNNNKSIFESSISSSSAQTNNEMKNYSKYTLQSNNKYMAISRIEDTVIYVKVDIKYKDKIKDLLNEIGY